MLAQRTFEFDPVFYSSEPRKMVWRVYLKENASIHGQFMLCVTDWDTRRHYVCNLDRTFMRMHRMSRHLLFTTDDLLDHIRTALRDYEYKFFEDLEYPTRTVVVVFSRRFELYVDELRIECLYQPPRLQHVVHSTGGKINVGYTATSEPYFADFEQHLY